MILYFSATGNCKYVAARLAQAFDQRTLSIVECIRESNYAFEDSTLGIISPTYHWGLPSIMKEFLEKSSCAAEYLYFISTYGTTPGASGAIAQKAVHGRKIDAFYSVRMADTWTPTFDLSTPEKIAAFTAATEMQIDGIIRGVNERRANARMFPRLPAFLAELTAQPIYNVCARKTAHLHVEQDRCTGCGLCAKKCPVQAISMQNGRPVWIRKKCAMCLGCLHRCPRFAIQYGKRTQAHGQYTNPNVKL